jgi:hypothetical protein
VLRVIPGRSAALLALLLSAVALGACGESAQDKAKAQVCSARADINNQITKLEGLQLSTNVLNEGKAGFEAIGADLKKIKAAQPNLEPARKEQVEAATKTFETQLNTITASVAAKLTTGNPLSAISSAGPELKSAITQLAGDYKQALAPISCS